MTVAFQLEITPARESPYTVDLSEFALGGRFEVVEKDTARGGDFKGRPQLAAEIVELFTIVNPARSAAASMRGGLRQLFRFLDAQSESSGENIATCSDVTDAHGVALLRWLGGNHNAYRNIKTALNRIRALNGSRQLFWPNRRRDVATNEEPIEEEALRRLFHALRHEARDIKAMFNEGERLAEAGSDPRSASDKAAWTHPENRAWLVRNLLKDGLPDREGIRAAGAFELLVGPGPSYVAPSMGGIIGGGALRWFVPGRADMSILLSLFLLGTGWNLSTACAIDVSRPEGWWQPHPQSDQFAVIHAFKNRADRHQFTISMMRPEWHPYRILEFVITKTAPLRRAVNARLIQVRTEYIVKPSAELEAEIARLEGLSKNPWLFAPLSEVGSVSGFTPANDSGRIALAVRETAKAHGLDAKHPRLLEFVTSDARDAWIGHAYVQSGYQVLLTRLASQHASLRTLRHYLRAQRYRSHSEKQVRKLQHAVFSEIDANRVVDPSRLRLLVANGEITIEQEARLAELRTRLGMGCLEPHSPPPAVAPDHREGTLCRVQRCTGCSYGIVFPESMPALARAFAELRHLRRSIAITSWEGSSFADEYRSIEETLQKNFNQERVAGEVAAWTQKLNSGEVKVHGTYPEY